MSELMNTTEVAKMLNVSTTAIYYYMKKGWLAQHVKEVKPEGAKNVRKFWLKSDVLECIEDLKVKKKVVAKRATKKPSKKVVGGFSNAMNLMNVRGSL